MFQLKPVYFHLSFPIVPPEGGTIGKDEGSVAKILVENWQLCYHQIMGMAGNKQEMTNKKKPKKLENVLDKIKECIERRTVHPYHPCPKETKRTCDQFGRGLAHSQKWI